MSTCMTYTGFGHHCFPLFHHMMKSLLGKVLGDKIIQVDMEINTVALLQIKKEAYKD